MSSKINVTTYYELEGIIDKKSTHFILGFQAKFWKILDHGTKIGYRNIDQAEFLPQKIFNLTDVKTEELESLQEFQLHTPERVYELRTKSQQQCKKWMRAINSLKKDIRRKNKKNISRKNKRSKSKNYHHEDFERSAIQSPQFSHIQGKTERRQKQLHQLPLYSPSNQSRINQSKDQYRQTRSNSRYKKGLNDTTLPSVNQTYTFEKQIADFRQSTLSILNRNGSSLAITNLSRESIQPSIMSNIDENIKQKFNEFLKKMGPDYINFHVFIMKLKTKSKELLTTSINSHYYIFFSSKSLYPEQHIKEQNLTSPLLPYWADINTFYRLSNDIKSQKLFELSKVEQTQTGKSDYSIQIKSENESFQFYVDSIEEQKNFKFIIEMGKLNALETDRNQLCIKKNYDLLVLLHTTNLIEFGQKIKEIVRKLMPTDHNYELNIFSKFVSNLNPQIFEIITILEHKLNKQSIRNTLVDFVKIVHEELKIFLKLIWDSSFDKAKGVDISNILKSISTYHNLVNKYVVKDIEIYHAEKQLSKIYMRFSYKNFEKIIINIVDKQKNAKYYTVQNEDEDPFTQTHAITDMFQFIYDVFALAFPCWNEKLHLHNIHKLIYKAISIFIKQLKAMIDEEDLQVPLLIAIANNYVTFTEQIDEFYENKFSQLKQGTKECYDELKTQFRQTSMVVIDKLVLPLKIQLKIFFDKQKFYNASMEQTYRLIMKSEIYQNMSNIHFILRRRYYERIFSTIRQQICKMLEKEVQSFKKKKQLKKVVEKINTYKTDCLQMAHLLCKSKLKLEKQFSQLIMLLTTHKKEQIAFLLTQSNQFYKKVYKKILTLREDYSSTIQIYLRNVQIQSPLKSPQKYPSNNQLQPRKSFSKQYMMEYDRNSIQFSSVQRVAQPSSPEEKIRMISEGFVYRNKSNNGAYEKIFFKLKKSVLYIYENQKMERCQNTVQIEDIEQIKVANQERPYFTICFIALHRSKQLKIKCESVQQSRRWIYTIQLQLKRLKNDKKMKVIKTKELKSNLIIDYEELTNGRDYFSYND